MKKSHIFSCCSSDHRKVRASSFYFCLLALIVVFVIVLYGEDFNLLYRGRSWFENPKLDGSKLKTVPAAILPSPPPPPSPPPSPPPTEEAKEKDDTDKETTQKETIILDTTIETTKTRAQTQTDNEECDVFSGKWVRDEKNRPLYQELECPYIQPQLTCQQHGRLDKGYQFLRWQPHGCSLPRFNATFMLEKLRGRRMMFVGDSLNRGQYVSMICMLHRVLPDHAKSMQTFDSLTVFRAEDYNASIEFYWAPFLLESNSDNAVIHRVTDRIVRKGSINKHGKYWLGADILVFNTYLWWVTGMKMKVLRGSFNDEKKDIVEMETHEAYRMAMKSLVKWIQTNVNPEKNRVFFTSMSPSHGKSIEWGGDADGNCYNQTSPIEDPTYWGTSSLKSIMKVMREVFDKSEVPITFLNITQLSEYRKDAHTSIYKKQWSPLTPEQIANPVSYSDCVHWCLPGLQDTWNELLYAKLIDPSKS